MLTKKHQALKKQNEDQSMEVEYEEEDDDLFAARNASSRNISGRLLKSQLLIVAVHRLRGVDFPSSFLLTLRTLVWTLLLAAIVLENRTDVVRAHHARVRHLLQLGEHAGALRHDASDANQRLSLIHI